MQQYMDAFSITDHKAIIDCLSDDVIWEMLVYILMGSPMISVTLMIAENAIVVAEEEVTCMTKNDRLMELVFCDVFHMENTKINRLTSHIMQK